MLAPCAALGALPAAPAARGKRGARHGRRRATGRARQNSQQLRRGGRYTRPSTEKKRAAFVPPAGRKVKVQRPPERGGGRYIVDLALPAQKASPKGIVCFLHGFSQYPLAYWDTLHELATDLGVLIGAPETGIFSLRVLRRWLSGEFGRSPDALQESLQRTLAEDALQMLDLMRQRAPPFDDLELSEDLPRAMMGHSMGGGLCFYVGRHARIPALAAMAPFPQLQGDLDPSKNIASDPPSEAVLLAGGWDFIARGSPTEKPGEAIKQLARMCGSNALYSEIPRGLHTGFEDELVIGDWPLIDGAGGLPGPSNFLERLIRFVLVITSGVQFLTDQLDISEAELSHFLRRTVVERRAGQEQVVLTTEEFRDAIDHDPDVRKEAGAATSLEFPGRSDGPLA